MHSTWVCGRAILTPTNDQKSAINIKIMNLFQSEERTYLSINTVLRDDDAVHYPLEFLNSITAPGLPAYEQKVKVGAPLILLRNLNPPNYVMEQGSSFEIFSDASLRQKY